METIKNYFDIMFANMPDTPEVRRAKEELWQMMEDKYNELIEEGKSENEAVGTVISEFGNLDELSEELGLDKNANNEEAAAEEAAKDDPAKDDPAKDDAVKEAPAKDGAAGAKTQSREPMKLAAKEEVEGCIKDVKFFSHGIGLGVCLCTACSTGVIIASAWEAGMPVALSILFLMIAAAVGLFILSSKRVIRWNYLFQGEYCLDYSVANYVKDEKEKNRKLYTCELSLGIVACCLCWLPCMLTSDADRRVFLMSPAFLLIIVGIGAFLIIYASCRKLGFNKLLELNTATSPKHHERQRANQPRYATPPKKYSNKTVATIMEIFWPTATCLYLIISFLTFAWHITWIIWPIAAIISAILKRAFRDEY